MRERESTEYVDPYIYAMIYAGFGEAGKVFEHFLALAGAAGWLALGTSPASAQYLQLNLVGYQKGMGRHTDPRLNGWGMAFAPDGPFCVANTATGVATFYDRSGKPLPIVITVPAAPSQPFGPVGSPTGVAYNPTSDFVISKNGKSGPAVFVFDTLDGTLSGWNPDVDPDNAIMMVDIFDTDGNLLTPNHFAANAPEAGPLVNPWAISKAPSNFGVFSSALLIGNVEDGKINAFDSNTGAFLGSLERPNGTPIVIDGLWDFSFGADSRNNGKSNQLYFTAGPNIVDFAGNGLFGMIFAAGPQGPSAVGKK